MRNSVKIRHTILVRPNTEPGETEPIWVIMYTAFVREAMCTEIDLTTEELDLLFAISVARATCTQN